MKIDRRAKTAEPPSGGLPRNGEVKLGETRLPFGVAVEVGLPKVAHPLWVAIHQYVRTIIQDAVAVQERNAWFPRRAEPSYRGDRYSGTGMHGEPSFDLRQSTDVHDLQIRHRIRPHP